MGRAGRWMFADERASRRRPRPSGAYCRCSRRPINLPARAITSRSELGHGKADKSGMDATRGDDVARNFENEE